jgi:uncharacterized protein (DUF3820 family)
MQDFDFSAHSAQELLALVNAKMPFGKYAGTPLLELPEPYLVWFHKEGFPKSKLGEQLAIMYEIKLNGLEPVLRPLLHENREKEGYSADTEKRLQDIQERDKYRF